MWSNGWSTAGSALLLVTAIIYLQVATMLSGLLPLIGFWFLIPLFCGLVMWVVGFYQFQMKEKNKKPTLLDMLITKEMEKFSKRLFSKDDIGEMINRIKKEKEKKG